MDSQPWIQYLLLILNFTSICMDLNLIFYHRKRLCRHLFNQKLWMGPTSTSVNAAKRNAMPARWAHWKCDMVVLFHWRQCSVIDLPDSSINASLHRVWDFCTFPTCWHCSWSGLILTTPLCIASSLMTAWLSLRSLTWVHSLMWKMRWEQKWEWQYLYHINYGWPLCLAYFFKTPHCNFFKKWLLF